MESKRFEIKMSKKVWCAKNIENCLQIHHKGTVKVTEIQPPNFCYAPMSVEYCKCNIPLSNQEKETMVCNCCGKPIKSKPPEEYCECPKHLSVGVCCDVCHKPFKDKPKPPIEKLRGITGKIGSKVNEIISHINKEEK